MLPNIKSANRSIDHSLQREKGQTQQTDLCVEIQVESGRANESNEAQQGMMEVQ